MTDPKRERENLWCEFLAENAADLDPTEQIEIDAIVARAIKQVKPKPE